MLRRRPGGLPYPQVNLTAPPESSTADQPRLPLVIPAPIAGRIGSVDVYANLLTTTLATVALLPFGAQKASASAPPVVQTVACEQAQSVLARGINPAPAVKQRWESAPPPKAPVVAEQQHNRLTLGINPAPATRQLSDSAPQVKSAVLSLDNANRLTLTVVVAVQPPGAQISEGIPKAPSAVYDIQQHNRLTLGINPAPAVQQRSESAPPPKAPVVAEQQPNRVLTDLTSTDGPRGTIAFVPQQKWPVVADQFINTLLLGINALPPIQRLDASAPPPKAEVVALTTPDATVLKAPPPAVPLPLSADRVDISTFQRKYELTPLWLPVRPSDAILTPAPLVSIRLDTSAPVEKYRPQVDVYPNLIANTLSAAPLPQPPGDQEIGESASLGTRRQPTDYQFVNTLNLSIPQFPAWYDWDQVPSLKYWPEPDVFPNLSLTTLAIKSIPPYGYSYTAPQQKREVVAEQYVNTLVRGINPLPLFGRTLDASAPPPKFAVTVDNFPNVAVRGIVLPPHPVLPLGLPVNTAQLQTKYQVQVDAYPNQLILGIPRPLPLSKPLDTSQFMAKYEVRPDYFPNPVILTLTKNVTVTLKAAIGYGQTGLLTSTTIVPNCVGLTWYAACDVLFVAGLIPVGPLYSNIKSILPTIVTAQDPAAGSVVPLRSPVLLTANNPGHLQGLSYDPQARF